MSHKWVLRHVDDFCADVHSATVASNAVGGILGSPCFRSIEDGQRAVVVEIVGHYPNVQSQIYLITVLHMTSNHDSILKRHRIQLPCY